jgi:nucleotide-binding universal stress UspA family protein
MRERLLVATDGKQGALGALRMALQIAERAEVRVEVLTVYETGDVYTAGWPDPVSSLPPRFAPPSVKGVRARVRAQLAEAGSGAAEWPLTVAMGRVAPTIARVAVERRASLILLGLHQPGAVERWFSREMLLRLIHLAHVPVVAVPQEAGALPRKVVLAVDFSQFAQRAASAVMQLVGAGAQLHLAHVVRIPAWTEGSSGWIGSTEVGETGKTYTTADERRLGALATELECPAEVDVIPHLLSGEPGPEILQLAAEVNADLIASGSHGAGFLGRIVMGSVSSRLVHGARCSLLIAPPEKVPAELLDLSER